MNPVCQPLPPCCVCPFSPATPHCQEELLMLPSLMMAIKQLDHAEAAEALGVLSAVLSSSTVMCCTSV